MNESVSSLKRFYSLCKRLLLCNYNMVPSFNVLNIVLNIFGILGNLCDFNFCRGNIWKINNQYLLILLFTSNVVIFRDKEFKQSMYLMEILSHIWISEAHTYMQVIRIVIPISLFKHVVWYFKICCELSSVCMPVLFWVTLCGVQVCVIMGDFHCCTCLCYYGWLSLVYMPVLFRVAFFSVHAWGILGKFL